MDRFYKVEISNGRKSTYHYREQLKNDGFIFKKTGKYTGHWEKYCTDIEIMEITHFCKEKKLRITVLDKRYSRNNHYRKIYFDTHKGLFGTEYYQCVYCGKFMKKDKTAVDHWIPVAKVLKNRHKDFYRNLLNRLKIDDINDKDNLVSACFRCNSKKGSKTGMWIIKGYLGRYFLYWVTIWLLGTVLIIWILQMIIEIKDLTYLSHIVLL